jgi:hypothetical protein
MFERLPIERELLELLELLDLTDDRGARRS